MSEDVREEGTGYAVPGAGRTVPCVSRRGAIAADSFVYWSSARRLVSAACPACERQFTLPVATWRRLSIVAP